MSKFETYIKNYEENIDKHLADIIDWTKNEFAKTGAKGVILGMSGGIDCCVTARIYQEAGIPVKLVLMPYGESMQLQGDDTDAMEFIKKFNFDYAIYDITNTVNSMVDVLDDISFVNPSSILKKEGRIMGIDYKIEKTLNEEKVKLTDMAVSNIKPRVRMSALYTLAQSLGYVVAGTGNLSERVMGYFTKWGDGASDINIIGNITKTQVRILGKALELPERIITKAPSANLWKGQTDEDEMGISYARLDAYIIFGEGTSSDKKLVESARNKVAHKFKAIPMYPGIPTEFKGGMVYEIKRFL